MKNFIKQRFLKNPFARHVSVLIGGTAIGQLIAILSLPVLTRLYEPEAFSALAVYASTLSLLSVIACMRMEIAIPLPKLDRIAAALCMLALASVLFFSVATALTAAIYPHVFNELTNNRINKFLWLIPFGVFSVGLYNAMQYWSTRRKKFELISKTRVIQSLAGNGVKLSAGFFLGGATAGLIVGQMLAQGSGFFSLCLSLVKNDLRVFRKVKLIHFVVAFKRYEKFPKYSLPESFANAGGIQIPVMLIAYCAIGGEAGYLMIAMQILSAPMGLIGNAVAQVYLAEGAERHCRGELKRFTCKTIVNLAKAAALPLLLAAIASPLLMPYVLGEEWQRTGVLISWMAPWFFMQFITSPVSMSLHITGNQRIAFSLQLLGLVLRVSSVLVAAKFWNFYIGEFYALSGLIFYAIYLLVILRVISKI